MHFSWRWGGFSYAGAAYQGADGAAGRSNRSARVPLWFVVSAGVLPAMVRLLLSLRSNRRRRFRHLAGLCPRCGYDLTANATGVCPECGGAVPTGAPPHAGPA
jgi:hypothetical protein